MPNREEQALLEELRVELISPEQKPRWNQLVRKHHYLKSAVLVGEQLRYGGHLMLVNAVAQPSQRLLGVEAVDRKTNEIPTARTLIGRLELPGKMVQLDGMHTQHQTVQQILYEKGADSSLILRDNQPTLLQTAQTLLPADLPPSTCRKPALGEVARSTARSWPGRLNPKNWVWRELSKSPGWIARLGSKAN